MRSLVLVFLLFLFISCDKKILEIVPVIDIERDMTIPNAGSIKFFSFPSDKIGYAASDTNFIYKTIDGGRSWKTINFKEGANCYGLEFFDENNGMCLMGYTIYATTDGGQTWITKGTASFIGKTKDGIGVTGSCLRSDCNISISTNKANTFQQIGTLTLSGYLTSARVIGSEVFLFSTEDYYYDRILGMDISKKESISIGLSNLTHGQDMVDIYLNNGRGAIVGWFGTILDNSIYRFSRNYYGHTYQYFSVDGYEDKIICVGDRTITAYLKLGDTTEWHEVFDSNGNGFKEEFYMIRFIDQNTFYISGSNGRIFKAKI